jgi:hypothetical protein
MLFVWSRPILLTDWVRGKLSFVSLLNKNAGREVFDSFRIGIEITSGDPPETELEACLRLELSSRVTPQTEHLPS